MTSTAEPSGDKGSSKIAGGGNSLHSATLTIHATAASVPDIETILKETKLERYAEVFREKNVATKTALEAISDTDNKGWNDFVAKLNLKPGHAARLRRELINVQMRVREEAEKLERADAWTVLAKVGYWGSDHGRWGTSLKLLFEGKNHYREFVFHPGFQSPPGAFRINGLQSNMSMGYSPSPNALHDFEIRLTKSGKHKITITESKSKKVFEKEFNDEKLFDSKEAPLVGFGREFPSTPDPLKMGAGVTESTPNGYGTHKMQLLSISKEMGDGSTKTLDAKLYNPKI